MQQLGAFQEYLGAMVPSDETKATPDDTGSQFAKEKGTSNLETIALKTIQSGDTLEKITLASTFGHAANEIAIAKEFWDGQRFKAILEVDCVEERTKAYRSLTYFPQ